MFSSVSTSAGPPTANPAELLASRRMRELIDNVAHNYDRVIIDSPPVLLVSDVKILAKLDIDTATSPAVVCGPPVMMKYGTRDLLRLGFREDRIYLSMEKKMSALRNDVAKVNCPVCGGPSNGSTKKKSPSGMLLAASPGLLVPP